MIKGKSLANAIVSNGLDVVTADSDGAYSLPFWGTHVYCIVTPGYSPFKGAIVRLAGADQTYDIFPEPCEHPVGGFVFAQMTDCHISQPGVMGTDGMNVSPAVFEAALGRLKTDAAPDFVMLTGDQVDIGTVNELNLMFEALERVDLPAVQVNGNHEAQCDLPREQIPSVPQEGLAPDEEVEDFYSYFGPRRFAFFWGKYLFIVLDCMTVWKREQHRWLAAMLKHIPAETPIVAAIHHPDMVFRFPELLERNLRLAISGHYHTHQTFREDGALHSSPSTALAAGVDGFPPAYRSYRMPAPDQCSTDSREVRITYETANVTDQASLRKVLVRHVDWPHYIQGCDGLETCWSKPLDGAVRRATAVVAEGRVVVSPYDLDAYPVGRLQVFDLASGEFVWSRRLGDGFFATPVVSDGLIYVQSVSGQAYAISLEDGYIVWRHDLGWKGGRCCTGRVVLEGDLAFVGDSTYFAALQSANGIEMWAWPEVRAGGAFYGGSTAAGQGVVLVGNGYEERGVITLNAETGELAWSVGDRRHARYSDAIFLDGCFYFCGPYDAVCVEANSGKVRWSAPCDTWTLPAPLVHRDKVFVAGSGGDLQALDRKSGEELWRTSLGRPMLPLMYNATEPKGQLAGPVAYGDAVLSASNDGNMYAIEPERGEVLRKYGFGIPLTSAPVVCGEHLIMATPDGTLWKFKLHLA
jgi:outer membrane protein assembly factor BamB